MKSSNSDTKHFEWSKAKSGWKDKSGKIVPFGEMTDAQLSKIYKLAQFKELMYLNKSYVFADKREEMEKEAEKRGIELKMLNTDYHQNEKVLKKGK